jgi:hypothetical protein
MKAIAKALAFTVLVLASIATDGVTALCWGVVAVVVLLSLMAEEEA